MSNPKPALSFIDSKGQPDAPKYYRLFRQEPVLPPFVTIHIGAQILLPEMTVIELLTKMSDKVDKNQSIMIVSHGTADGLSIPVYRNSQAFLQTNTLEVLQEFEDGKLKADEIAHMLYYTTSDFLHFWELVQKVRKLKLNRVELRSCLVGSNDKALKMLKAFFGSDSCTAPINFDVFGTINPGKPGPEAISKLLKKYPNAIITGEPPHRFALNVSVYQKYDAAADSETAINNWISTHLPGSAVKYSRQPIPVHGILPSKGPKKIIWAGETAYRSLLKKV